MPLRVRQKTSTPSSSTHRHVGCHVMKFAQELGCSAREISTVKKL